MAPPTTSPRTALILSACGIFCCPFLSVVGLIMGVKAKNEIDRSGGLAPGRGEAMAAIIIGGLVSAFFVLYWLGSALGGGS